MKRWRKNKHRPPASPAGVSKPSLPPARLSVWKKLLFSAITCVGFLLLLELVLALAGVKPKFYEEDPYVGFAGHVPLFVREPDNPAFFVTAKNKRRWFNMQRFAVRKPARAYRIFCLGGSTTYGHPYEDSTSFCGWLRAMLPKADPSRSWELVNAGGISYASYREAKLMEELIRYEPDLFVIYCGQNEFLERRTYPQAIAMPETVRSLHATLSRTRIHTALQTGLDILKATPVRKAEPRANLPAEVSTLLDNAVGPEVYHRDEALQKQVLDHFRYNLARMADIARAAGARIVFVTPASNLRDCAPFKSEHRPALSEAQLQQWENLVRQADQAQAGGRWPEALQAIDQALALDDRHAHLHYWRGQVLWQLNRFTDAKTAFLRALDEDVCPLRALSPMRQIVAEVAAQRHAPLVDFVQLLEGLSANGAPGEDWFLDHVHPTIEGNRRLALALMEVLGRENILHPVPAWNEVAQQEVRKLVESQLDTKAQALALNNLSKVIAWAGKREEAYRLAVRAVQLSPQDANVRFELGKNAGAVGRLDEAVLHCRKAIELNPRFVEAYAVLGNTLVAQGALAEAINQYQQGLRLRPNDPDLHNNLGSVLEQHGDVAGAIGHLRQALQLAPAFAEAHSNLGAILKAQGQRDEALRHFREALQAKPGLLRPMQGLAWILATHPDPRLRDPREAIRLGERLVDLSQRRNWMDLDTLAAGYAAAGRYSEAARLAQRALELAQAASPAEAAGVAQRLALYQQQKPFVESAKAP